MNTVLAAIFDSRGTFSQKRELRETYINYAVNLLILIKPGHSALGAHHQER